MQSMRRSIAIFASVLAFALIGPAQAAEGRIPQLSGTLTESTYPEFERFVGDHVNKVVGLKIAVERSNSDDAPLQAFVDDGALVDNGALVIYLKPTPDEPSESEIVVDKNFSYRNGAYHLDGLFIVKNEGTNQGVVSYSLRKAKEAGGGRLNPSIKFEQVELGKAK